MGWKNWPSWLKGGVIGITLYVLIGIFIWFLEGKMDAGGMRGFFSFIYFLTPGLFIFGYNFDGPIVPIYTLSIILSIASYFLVGALIGWIIGKLKSKKQVQQPIVKS